MQLVLMLPLLLFYVKDTHPLVMNNERSTFSFPLTQKIRKKQETAQFAHKKGSHKE